MNKADHFKNNRESAREATVAALRDGRKTRSARFTDRKKAARKNACRKGNWS